MQTRRAAGLMLMMGALGCVGGVATVPQMGADELATLRLRGGTGQVTSWPTGLKREGGSQCLRTDSAVRRRV